MILIDERERDVPPYLARFDVPFASCRLDFGDAFFEGNGPRGRTQIGFERKKLMDLIGSMKDRRLSGHQLRGMWASYDYVYLTIEGLWRPGDGGSIEIFSGNGWAPLYFKSNGISYRQVDSFISTLELLGNVIVCRTAGVSETAALYVSRYHWWQKAWSAHHSHDMIHSNGPDKRLAGPVERGRGWIPAREPGYIAKIAAQLPHVDRKAFEVEDYFKSPRAMANATEQQWKKALGIEKGTKVARDIVRVWKGES